MWLFLIFVIVPIIEIALFIQLGGLIGFWPTIAIVILTAFAGSILLRSQGLQTLARLQASTEGRDNPVDTLAHGALLLVAGVVLVTPGFFTDAFGLALMIPQVRQLLIAQFSDQIVMRAQTVQSRTTRTKPRDPDVIDGTYERLDD